MKFILALLLAIGSMFHAFSYLFKKTAKTVMLFIALGFTVASAIMGIVVLIKTKTKTSKLKACKSKLCKAK